MNSAGRCWASVTSRSTSRDLEAAERFWVDVMGYEVEWRPDPDNVYLHGGRDNLALHRGDVSTGGQLDHIGIAVADRGRRRRLGRASGRARVPLKAQPKTHRDGSRSLYFYGPQIAAHPDHPPRRP